MLSSRLNQRISDSLHNLTPSEKLIGHHLSQDATPIAFQPASAVAEQIGTSEATLSRFARTLAYDTYSDLQKDVRDEIQRLLAHSEREHGSEPQRENHADSPFAVLEQTFHHDSDNLRRTLSRISPHSFNAAVETLARARRVYVVGFRASAGVATYLGYLLNLVHPDVRTLANSPETVFDHLLSLEKSDVVICITLSRATTRMRDAMAFAKQAGASLILMTDVMSSSPAELADYVFVADSTTTGYVQSYTAVTSLAAALAYCVAIIDEHTATARLERMEHVFDDFVIVDPALDKRRINGGHEVP